MLVPTLLSAGFALTANAFLLPPEAAKTFETAKNELHSHPHVIDPLSRTVNVDCSGCPYALASQRNGRHEWTNDVKSSLELKITAEDEKLKLNGVPFYPVAPPFAPAPLYAKQIKKSNDEHSTPEEGFDRPLMLSYSLEFEKEKKAFPGPGQDATLTEVTLSILGLDNEVVHVDDVKIKVLDIPNTKDLKHELILVSVDTEPTDQNSADAQCGTIMCRVIYKFKSAIRKAQSHAKTAAHKVKCFCTKCFHAFKHGGHGRPQSRPTYQNRPARLPTHHRMRPAYVGLKHAGHRQHSGWVHAFARASRQIFSFVILPILLGVVFGIAASAVGMLVGQVIVAIWLRLRRSRGSTVKYEPVASEEKEGLPKYEDLDDAKTVTDEKV
ncbi:MAG: hypothetical protein Q9174_001255 [Haloplaca sp. 1 TL-2023]